MPKHLIAFVLLIFAAAVHAEPRVLIVSVDGLRPDCLLRAEAPVIRELMKTGSFTMWATTTEAAITLPSHTSMLTGVVIAKHGMRANNDTAAATQPIRVPTIFQLAKEVQIPTGMAAGKSKFYIYSDPVPHAWVSKESVCKSETVADGAIEIIREHRPRLMFLHFGWVDRQGHSKGWGSDEQLAAIADVDQHLGRVLKELDRLRLRQDTTIILSADHGGSGIGHGGLDPRSQHIPWIINGPGIRENLDLARFGKLKVQTYDTFATACKILNISIPEDIDGKAVEAAFIASELMVDAPKPSTRPSTAPTTRPAISERSAK
jgi:predicted AlkP superfamily pyrophosphatase or phosphodiesterase